MTKVLVVLCRIHETPNNELRCFLPRFNLCICFYLSLHLFILNTDFTPVIPPHRDLEETLVYQELQESPDWLVCLAPSDQLGLPDLPALQDQVIVLDL